MQPGNPSALLTEELIDILKEVNNLNQWTASAQEMLDSKDQAYALVWFLYNTKTLKGHLISTAFCLDPEERPLKTFHYFSAEPPEQHVTLHDLGTKFAALRDKIKHLQIAYQDYIKDNRPASAFFAAAALQLGLMEWNLDQAKNVPQ